MPMNKYLTNKFIYCFIWCIISLIIIQFDSTVDAPLWRYFYSDIKWIIVILIGWRCTVYIYRYTGGLRQKNMCLSTWNRFKGKKKGLVIATNMWVCATQRILWRAAAQRTDDVSRMIYAVGVEMLNVCCAPIKSRLTPRSAAKSARGNPLWK